MAVQIILSCRAARPDPRNSYHTSTKSQIICNSFNNDHQIILSCRAARPDPHNSHHTVTKSQSIRNSVNNDPISFSCRLWIPSNFHIKSYIFMIMTWRSILVFEISARNVQCLPEILGSGQNIRFHSVNMTCRSILVFEISARNVQFLPGILGSGQKHKETQTI